MTWGRGGGGGVTTGTETQVSRLLAGLTSPGRSLWPGRTSGTETKKNRGEEMSVPLSGQVLGGGVGGLTVGQSVREHLGLGRGWVGRDHQPGSLQVHTGPAPARTPGLWWELCTRQQGGVCPSLPRSQDSGSRLQADPVQTSPGGCVAVQWEDVPGLCLTHSESETSHPPTRGPRRVLSSGSLSLDEPASK